MCIPFDTYVRVVGFIILSILHVRIFGVACWASKDAKLAFESCCLSTWDAALKKGCWEGNADPWTCCFHYDSSHCSNLRATVTPDCLQQTTKSIIARKPVRQCVLLNSQAVFTFMASLQHGVAEVVWNHRSCMMSVATVLIFALSSYGSHGQKPPWPEKQCVSGWSTSLFAKVIGFMQMGKPVINPPLYENLTRTKDTQYTDDWFRVRSMLMEMAISCWRVSLQSITSDFFHRLPRTLEPWHLLSPEPFSHSSEISHVRLVGVIIERHELSMLPSLNGTLALVVAADRASIKLWTPMIALWACYARTHGYGFEAYAPNEDSEHDMLRRFAPNWLRFIALAQSLASGLYTWVLAVELDMIVQLPCWFVPLHDEIMPVSHSHVAVRDTSIAQDTNAGFLVVRNSRVGHLFLRLLLAKLPWLCTNFMAVRPEQMALDETLLELLGVEAQLSSRFPSLHSMPDSGRSELWREFATNGYTSKCFFGLSWRAPSYYVYCWRKAIEQMLGTYPNRAVSWIRLVPPTVADVNYVPRPWEGRTVVPFLPLGDQVRKQFYPLGYQGHGIIHHYAGLKTQGLIQELRSLVAAPAGYAMDNGCLAVQQRAQDLNMTCAKGTRGVCPELHLDAREGQIC